MFKKLLALSRYPEFIRLFIWKKITPLNLRRKGVLVGKNVKFFGTPIISIFPNSTLSIGDKANICSNSKYTALGVNHPVIFRTLRSGAVINLGADTGISGGCICAAVSIKIGSHCLIGANVVISDSDFHSTKAKNRRYNNSIEDINAAPIQIENNVFIGTGSIILKGVFIGENSVIGAGSVVTKSFPRNSILAGNPAKLIGQVP